MVVQEAVAMDLAMVAALVAGVATVSRPMRQKTFGSRVELRNSQSRIEDKQRKCPHQEIAQSTRIRHETLRADKRFRPYQRQQLRFSRYKADPLR